MMKQNIRKKKIAVLFVLYAVLAIVIITLLSYIQDMLYLKQAEHEQGMLAFRSLNFSEDTMKTFHNLYQDKESDWEDNLTFAMLNQRFHLDNEKDLVTKRIPAYYKNSAVYQRFKNRYKAVFKDIKYFPVGRDVDGGERCYYENSWYNDRTYGGKRFHEGTDIMTSNNERGYFPVYSMTDGVVEQKGWLKLGGWRLGIRSKNSAYFYYAHMAQYADDIEVGNHIKAGQLIGYVGDTGYSKKEGTTGNFPVHLHIGIYLQEKEGEMSVNPYWVLKGIESKKKAFHSSN